MISGKKAFLLLALNSVVVFSCFAQSFYSSNAWKSQRMEVGASIGASNFLGELGGRDAIGTNFVRDWELSMVRYSAQVYYTYYLGPNSAIKTNISWALLQGDDKLTKEPFRNNRNLNFKSNVFEFSTVYQLFFVKERLGHKYGLKNIRHHKIGVRANSFGGYLVGGIGVFYYNPKGQYGNQGWVNLHPLHTEGQGLEGGPKQYKRVSISFPVGIGMRKSLSRNDGLYLEFTQHYTITDYLDDVSGSYYDNVALYNNYGSVSAYMADPNLGMITTPTGYSYVTETGQQRGDYKDRDNFMMFTIGYYYRIHTSVGPYRKSMKRRRVKSLL